MEVVGKKFSTSGVHRTGFCIINNMPCRTDSWLFPVPNQKKMVMVSGLCTSPS